MAVSDCGKLSNDGRIYLSERVCQRDQCNGMVDNKERTGRRRGAEKEGDVGGEVFNGDRPQIFWECG